MTRKAWNSTLAPRRPRKATRIPKAPLLAGGEGAAVLHQGMFRSDDLRKLAALCPKCQRCGKANVGPDGGPGDVVGAHSPANEHGHGAGQKSHDVLAYLCHDCHDLVDGRRFGWAREDRIREWLEAAYWSQVWLLKSGHLVVRVEVAA